MFRPPLGPKKCVQIILSIYNLMDGSQFGVTCNTFIYCTHLIIIRYWRTPTFQNAKTII